MPKNTLLFQRLGPRQRLEKLHGCEMGNVVHAPEVGITLIDLGPFGSIKDAVAANE